MKWYTKVGLLLLAIPFMLIKGVLWLIGLIPIALVIHWKGPQSRNWPWFMKPWANKEEGCPIWWLEDAAAVGKFIGKHPVWWWYAMRNSVNGMRNWFHDPAKHLLKVETNWNTTLAMEAVPLMQAKQNMAYCWTRYKWMIGYRRVWISKKPGRYSEFVFGWKLGSNVPGVGVTIQPRFNRVIGR